jgi:hypothetical protein
MIAGVPSLKQTVTSFKVSVVVLSVVLNAVLQMPAIDLASDAPLMVKNVAAVRQTTKLKGVKAVARCTLNFMAVFAGVIAFHDSVVQWGTKPAGGFASRARR